MGIVEDISEDWHAALAALAWQVDLGISESVGDAAVNRYELAAQLPPAARVAEAAPSRVGSPGGDTAVMAAEAAAAGAEDLVALRGAMDAFPHCLLRQGARNLVFAEGRLGARVLVLGPAPGREEDQEGRVFAGLAGILFDKMFAAIGLARGSQEQKTGIYLCPVLPWRLPSDRTPDADEIAMMRPFVMRHIALAQPEVVVAMGNVAAALLLGKAEETGIGRLRGRWHESMGLPVLPMFDPAHLMRNPAAKREAWADLLTLQIRLRGQR